MAQADSMVQAAPVENSDFMEFKKRVKQKTGILFVGGTERIFDSRALGFDMPLPFFVI